MHLVYIMRMRGEAVFSVFLHSAPSFSGSGLLNQSEQHAVLLLTAVSTSSWPGTGATSRNNRLLAQVAAGNQTPGPQDLFLFFTHPCVLDLSCFFFLNFFLQIYKLTAYKAELIMEIYDNPFDSLWPLPHSSTFHFLLSRYGKWWSES